MAAGDSRSRDGKIHVGKYIARVYHADALVVVGGGGRWVVDGGPWWAAAAVGGGGWWAAPLQN
eukprot:SAG11_NODE_3174_length_2633_cov_4.697316_3_plen_63_part_00